MLEFLFKTALIVMSIWGNSDYVLSEEDKSILYNVIGGKFRYYTYLNNYITIFSLILGYFRKFSMFHNIHSYFMTFCLCTQFTLNTFYWFFVTFYFDFVLRKQLETRFQTIFLDLSLHGLPMLACMAEPVEIFRSVKTMLLTLITFHGCYISLFCYFNKVTGRWVYEFIDVLDNFGVFLFLLYLFLSPIIFYFFLLIFMPVKKKNGRKVKKD